MNNLVYFLAIIIFTSGLFIMLTSSNYLRKIIGLGVLQGSVLIFYIAFGKVQGGAPPILSDRIITYSNPLPHVLMLTAIVVGFATMSVGLALIYRIHKQFKTIDESEIDLKEGDDEPSN
jgi:multicomponent Na+:H+ antiporter subunit C